MPIITAIPSHNASDVSAQPQLETPPWLLSNYEDSRWAIADPNPANNASRSVIRWDRELDVGGASLMYPERRHLLETFRAYLILLWRRPLRGVVEPSSIVSRADCIFPIAAWVIDRGIERFCDMDEENIRDLKLSLYARPGKLASDSITESSLRRYFLVLDELHEYYRLGELADGLKHDPARLEQDLLRRAADEANRQSSNRKRARIPEPVAQALLNHALLLVEQKADALLATRDAIQDLRAREIARGIGWSMIWKRQKRCLLEIAPQDLGRPIDTESSLDWALSRLLTACFIVTIGFSGFRISELCDLSEDCLVEKGDGGWLNGRVLKTASTQQGAKVTRTVPDVVARAIVVAGRLTEPVRTLSGQGGLFRVMQNQRTSLLVPYGLEKVDSTLPKGKGWCYRVNTFADDFNLNRWTDPDGAECRWNFTNHQFRRFFALFYVRRFEGNLDALRYHFRHISEQMIWAYISDPETATFLKEEKHDFTVDLMTRIAEGTVRATGGTGQEIAGLGLQYRAMNMRPDALRSAVRRLVEEERVEIRANAYGYCVHSPKRAQRARCGLDDTGLPNEANRTFATCSGCANACFTEDRLPELKLRWLSHQELVSARDVPEIMKVESRNELVRLEAKIIDLQEGNP